MFKVRHKETGEIRTVYAINGSMFLLYDFCHNEWYYEYIRFFEPLED